MEVEHRRGSKGARNAMHTLKCVPFQRRGPAMLVSSFADFGHFVLRTSAAGKPSSSPKNYHREHLLRT